MRSTTVSKMTKTLKDRSKLECGLKLFHLSSKVCDHILKLCCCASPFMHEFEYPFLRLFVTRVQKVKVERCLILK